MLSLYNSLALVAISSPLGFTVDCKTLQPINSGFAVSVAETQNSFGSEGLRRVIAFVENHPEINAFGGWYNSEDGRYYFDATVVVDTLGAAEELARKNGQYAFFDLGNCQEIRIKY